MKAIDTNKIVARGLFAEAVRSHKRDAERIKRQAATLRKLRAKLVSVMQHLSKLMESVPENDRSMWISMWDKPSIRVSLYNQKSLRSDVICELLEYSLTLGEAKQSHDYVSATHGERTHRVTNPEFDVEISVSVAEDGTCKKVLKGQRTTVVDEYEFVCE